MNLRYHILNTVSLLNILHPIILSSVCQTNALGSILSHLPPFQEDITLQQLFYENLIFFC